MRLVSPFDGAGVPNEQRVDVGEMLSDCHFVALSLVALVPLIVIVENQGNEGRRSRPRIDGALLTDKAMEPAVEVGEVVVAMIDILQNF